MQWRCIVDRSTDQVELEHMDYTSKSVRFVFPLAVWPRLQMTIILGNDGEPLFCPASGEPQMAQGALPKHNLEEVIKDVLKVEK